MCESDLALRLHRFQDHRVLIVQRWIILVQFLLIFDGILHPKLVSWRGNAKKVCYPFASDEHANYLKYSRL